MTEIRFCEPIIYGVRGKSGDVHFGGLSVSPRDSKVSLFPLGPNGKQISAGMTLFSADCGEVARAIAEAAVRADPRTREQVAAQLRAALVTIESGADDELDDAVSDFSSFRS